MDLDPPKLCLHVQVYGTVRGTVPNRAMVFNESLEWVGRVHCGHPRGAVAVYSF